MSKQPKDIEEISKVIVLLENFGGTKREITLPRLQGNLGKGFIADTAPLKDTGVILVSKGGRAVTPHEKTEISFVDGEACKLYLRGYDFTDLVDRDIIEIFGLLIDGDLPDEDRYNVLEDRFFFHRHMPPEVRKALKSDFCLGKNPLFVMHHAMSLVTLAMHPSSPPAAGHSALREELNAIYGMFPALTAAAFHLSKGRKNFVDPPSSGRYVERLEYMLFGDRSGFAPDPLRQFCLNLTLVTMCEHGSNASMSSALATHEAGTVPQLSIANFLATLSGKRHGGAAEDVMRMFEKILDDRGRSHDEAIADIAARFENKQITLPGYGHGLYKGNDPRMITIFNILARLKEHGISNERFDIAIKLKEAVEKTARFQELPYGFNVDFVSGVLEFIAGLPANMAGAMFALSRIAGVVARIREATKTVQLEGGRFDEVPAPLIRFPEYSGITHTRSIENAPPPAVDLGVDALLRGIRKNPVMAAGRTLAPAP